MKYCTTIQKRLMIIFQNEFDAASDVEAQEIHSENLRVCSNEISADWDNASLTLINESGNIMKFLL